MTTAADITVKKADGTTDIIWSLLAGSGGDNAPAVWRSGTAAGTVGQKPTFQVLTKDNGNKTARRIEFSGKFPSVYTNTSTGQTEVRAVIPFSASFAVPTNVAQVDMNEAAAQLLNLLSSVLAKSAVSTGYAPA
ncbi:TPA_asm: coat protein [ssRNA phage Esthiorhiza.2_49]|uniref:Coat protein n=3 Tax=Fiersviridae TaxID=2842319 RepID=A0A8S5L1U0_9VIRU|nr:coat protein [ssRNA phage Esthiorhiza.2_49]QDH86671.1 MAG: hypothetical protein H2RhizoLitter7429_000002 [Leviviridae sp.]DAD51568.1 TPA_asm: coat protein [ssRNA phage Esthiorhiza.2_49]